MREMHLEALDILLRLCAAGVLGAIIGFERRVHHKAIGIAGMMLISIGSHVPEWITGSLGAGLILAAFASSVLRNRQEDKAGDEPQEDAGERLHSKV